MKAIKLTEERINKILPENVKKSTVVSDNAKRVLAVLLNHYMSSQKALNSGFLAIDNVTLRHSCSMNNNNMLAAVQELIELSLITRVRGKKRSEGEPSVASCYYFNIENINSKPIVRPTPEELLMRFFKVSDTANINTNINSNIDTNSNVDIDIDSPIDIDDDIDINVDSNVDDYSNNIENKKNYILYNKKNIISYTVEETEPTEHCEGNSDTTEESDTNNSNDQHGIIPANAQTANAKPTLRLIFKNIAKAPKCKDLLTNYRDGLKLIGKDDKQGRLTLLQLSHNTIVNSPELQAGIKETENEDDLQLLRVMQNINHRLVSEEEAKAWYNSNVNKC